MKAPTWSVAPTSQGPAGSAWRVDVAKLRHERPDTEATVALWLLNMPGAHIAWAWWLLSAIHLRPIAGARAAVIRTPGATHEVLVAALDPAHEPPNPATFPIEDVRILTPLDVQQQYTAATDAAAAEVCELAARACCGGLLSPDQDFRHLWERYIVGTAEHLASGAHGRPS